MEPMIQLQNFRYLEKKMIKSEIKVGKNSTISNKNNRLRKQVVMFQEKRIC
jgi:hypothetical protein